VSEAWAKKFLEAAVFASRSAGAGPESGACGLGDGPVLGAAWSEEQQRSMDALVPAGLTAEQRRQVDQEAAAWVRTQDGLDRKRNHFLKAFRQEHGVSRKTYSPPVAAAYDAGLDAVNGDNDARLAAAAQRLLGLLGWVAVE
jgi:hypothetical protein